jgi:teichoic acid transport system permease protein
MLLLVVLLPPAEKISWLWSLIIPAIVLQFIFNLGVGMILARVISIVHDVTHLLPFAIRAWMYGSAVFYSYERFVHEPALLAVMKFNPLYNVIEIVRDCVLYDRIPAWESWATLAVVSLSALLIGFIFFWRGEETYGRD